MQRLTDIWRNLIVGQEPEDSGHVDPEDANQNDGRPSNEEVEATYRNLYWTRLVSLHNSSYSEI